MLLYKNNIKIKNETISNPFKKKKTKNKDKKNKKSRNF